jgi:hypothetical protein
MILWKKFSDPELTVAYLFDSISLVLSLMVFAALLVPVAVVSTNIDTIRTPDFVRFANEYLASRIKENEEVLKTVQHYRSKFESLNNKKELAAIEDFKSYIAETDPYYKIHDAFGEYRTEQARKGTKEFPTIYNFIKDRTHLPLMPLEIAAHEEAILKHRDGSFKLLDEVYEDLLKNLSKLSTDYDRVKYLEPQLEEVLKKSSKEESIAFDKYKEFRLTEFKYEIQYKNFTKIKRAELKKLKAKIPLTIEWLNDRGASDFFYYPFFIEACKTLLKEDSILNKKAESQAPEEKPGNSNTLNIVLLIVGLLGVTASILLAVFIKGRLFYVYLSAGIVSAVVSLIGLVMLLRK